MKRLFEKLNNHKVKIIIAACLAAIIVGELGYIVTSHITSVVKEKEAIEKFVHKNGDSAEEENKEEAPEEPVQDPDEQDMEVNGIVDKRPSASQAGEGRDLQGDPSMVNGSKIIVLDPGHGKSSSKMTDDEKIAYGWKKTSKGWGEWRHYKIGSGNVDCEGSGCNERVTPNGACWYPIGNGDRATEPDINLQNALAAKKYLEQMGYTVRLTRETNDENPSITRRLEYCYPNLDKTKQPDATLFLCIHSNASNGSARGSAYIQLDGIYDQKWITSAASYVNEGNKLGKLCNDAIVDGTSLSMSGNGVISFEPQLIAFMKSPVTCGYLEIGFFDNTADLNILRTESDAIGKAIAMGIDQYCNGV
ncbi:MAG: N-acetylmuramoyl-L-alanine amidase [Oscillospiraceae bacterium]|nr:N-acetylmuramoyl-L-alanine amidase [Oscillospiraceae bacterium]